MVICQCLYDYIALLFRELIDVIRCLRIFLEDILRRSAVMDFLTPCNRCVAKLIAYKSSDTDSIEELSILKRW